MSFLRRRRVDESRGDRNSASTGSWGELRGHGSAARIELEGHAPGVLALHGFGSTPDEVRLVAEAAHSQRLNAVAPCLPGHGTHVNDLKGTGYHDWYTAAEAELLRISERGPVIVGGLSTGSLIAMELAARHRQRVAGLFSLSSATALRWPYPDLALRLAGAFRVPDFALPKKDGPDIGDPIGKAQHLNYASQPFHAALEVRNAGPRVRRLLTRVTCPVFIAHGKKDRVCPVKNAWQVASDVSSTDVTVQILPRSHHILTKDFDREELDHCLRQFFRYCADRTPVDP